MGRPKVHIISQNPDVTVIKCPRCHLAISLWHEENDEPNSGFGRLDLKQQSSVRHVVCMNRTPRHDGTHEYCEFSDDVKFSKWSCL